MMSASTVHRLEGLEPDNLLAFLALLGLLCSLERNDKDRSESGRWFPRVAWDVDSPPVRPILHVAKCVTKDEIAQAAVDGVECLVAAHEFGGQKDLVYGRVDAREVLEAAIGGSTSDSRYRLDLLASLMTDAAIKQSKKEVVIEPTPFCLMFGQGHQHFLQRLAEVPSQPAPPPSGRGKTAVELSPAACIAEAVFSSWHRSNPTFSFRWDPEEDVRYALLPGNPTTPAYKAGTQHGANRLAAIGLSTLTVIPQVRRARVRVGVLGGRYDRTGFSFAWPIWQLPLTLPAIRAVLSHPDIRKPGAMKHLGIDHVLLSKRISVGKFMNFNRARRLSTEGVGLS